MEYYCHYCHDWFEDAYCEAHFESVHSQKEALEAVEKLNEELLVKYTNKNDKEPYKDWLSLKPIISLTLADHYFFISLTILYYECP